MKEENKEGRIQITMLDVGRLVWTTKGLNYAKTSIKGQKQEKQRELEKEHN